MPILRNSFYLKHNFIINLSACISEQYNCHYPIILSIINFEVMLWIKKFKFKLEIRCTYYNKYYLEVKN
jgi:hypothetical protein